MNVKTPLVMARNEFKARWGMKLTPAQERGLQVSLSRGDGVVVMPTSGGKSAVYQLPVVMYGETRVVVEPILALMRDQVRKCDQLGIPATYLDSTLSQEETDRRKIGIKNGKYRLIYVSPERLVTKEFGELADEVEFDVIVFDEFHTASLWGNGFRPAYQRIARWVAERKKRPRLQGYTGTATNRVLSDAIRYVGMSKPERFVALPTRSNLVYRVFSDENAFNSLRSVVRQWNVREGKRIVYVRSRKGAESIADVIGKMLAEVGVADGPAMVAPYHGGMYHKTTHYDGPGGYSTVTHGRDATQERFTKGVAPIMVATSAFGMGVDMPDVREVFHLGMPHSLEDYLQESGRAGRDGLPAFASLAYTTEDSKRAAAWVDDQHPHSDTHALVWSYLRQFYFDPKIINAESFVGRFNDEKCPVEKLTVRAFHTILNMLRARQYVDYLPTATQIEVYTESLVAMRERIASANLSDVTRYVARSLMGHFDQARANRCTVRPTSLSAKQDAAEAAKGLSVLSRMGVIGFSDAFGDPLVCLRTQDKMDSLHMDEVQDIREAAMFRFNAMHEYAKSGNTSLLTDYFAKPDELEK